jgi:hypothetical protein
MKTIDADYRAKVGYWTSRNNVQKYNVYVRMIQIFDSDLVNNLQQSHGDNLWPVELTNRNYRTRLLCQV